MMVSGYRKNPPSWKNLISPFIEPTIDSPQEKATAQGKPRELCVT
jgi:hypothetical protein